MAETIVFGISGMAAGLLDGFDHFARFRDGNDRISSSVKNPKRHSSDPDGHLWITASAEGNRGRKNIGPLRDCIPSSVATVGLPRQIDPSGVDVESRFDRVEYFKHKTDSGAQFIEPIHPIAWTLRNQN